MRMLALQDLGRRDFALALGMVLDLGLAGSRTRAPRCSPASAGASPGPSRSPQACGLHQPVGA
eukprot:15464476-Alexandrium_andersonii.AAC.1